MEIFKILQRFKTFAEARDEAKDICSLYRTEAKVKRTDFGWTLLVLSSIWPEIAADAEIDYWIDRYLDRQLEREIDLEIDFIVQEQAAALDEALYHYRNYRLSDWHYTDDDD